MAWFKRARFFLKNFYPDSFLKTKTEEKKSPYRVLARCAYTIRSCHVDQAKGWWLGPIRSLLKDPGEFPGIWQDHGSCHSNKYHVFCWDADGRSVLPGSSGIDYGLSSNLSPTYSIRKKNLSPMYQKKTLAEIYCFTWMLMQIQLFRLSNISMHF
jgi:hypothetical protein